MYVGMLEPYVRARAEQVNMTELHVRPSFSLTTELQWTSKTKS